MRILMSSPTKQIVLPASPVNFQGNLSYNLEPFFRRKDKIVTIMGATGTGKSRLAIDLAARFPAEIINSDKIQVYKGLDIVTNKVTEEECRGVPHHLLGLINPNSDFTADDFRHHALSTIDSILARDRLPIIAGGSNSYIKALINDDPEFRFRYDVCFLWVDVSLSVLHSFVSQRVDRMVESGLINEARKIFDPKADYNCGIRQAIGVPELDEFLRAESNIINIDVKTRKRLLDTAITKIKENTCNLACRQLTKILNLRSKYNWNLHRLDATEAFLRFGSKDFDEAWDKLVEGPSNETVNQFLCDDDNVVCCRHRHRYSTPLSVRVVTAGTP